MYVHYIIWVWVIRSLWSLSSLDCCIITSHTHHRHILFQHLMNPSSVLVYLQPFTNLHSDCMNLCVMCPHPIFTLTGCTAVVAAAASPLPPPGRTPRPCQLPCRLKCPTIGVVVRKLCLVLFSSSFHGILFIFHTSDPVKTSTC